MALFKIKRGLNANLPDVSTSTDGYAWFVTDTGDFFIDYLDKTTNTVKRKKISSEYAEKLRYTEGGELIEFDPKTVVTQDKLQAAIDGLAYDFNVVAHLSEDGELYFNKELIVDAEEVTF